MKPSRDKHAIPEGEAEANLADYPLVKEKRGRGREPGFRMSDAHRVKIQNSNILSYLISCAEGNREMSTTQATVGVALLKKVLPDLQSMTIAGDPANPLKLDITRIERRVVDTKA